MIKRTFHHAILDYNNELHRNFLGYPINLGNGNTGYSNSYRDIMLKIINDIENQTNIHNSIFIVRFDLMWGDCLSKNDRSAQKVISHFNKMVSNYLNKSVKKTRCPQQQNLRNHKNIFIRWVREKSRSKGYHYHCYICFDAKKLNTIGPSSSTISSLRSLLNHYWLNCCLSIDPFSLPYIHINSGNKKASYIIRSNSLDRGESMIRTVIYHLSYLAKVRSKTYNQKNNKGLSTHSIPIIKPIVK